MGVYRATVDLTYPVGSGRGTNTWTLRTPGGLDGVQITALMAYVRTFYTTLTFLFPTGYSAQWDGTVRELGTPTPELGPGLSPWTVNGTAASSAGYVSSASQICVTWRSSLATRRGRGRTFLGPIAVSNLQANGTIADAALTTVREAAADLVTSSQATEGAGALAVWSEKDNLARDFVASSVTDQFAVLRSRR